MLFSFNECVYAQAPQLLFSKSNITMCFEINLELTFIFDILKVTVLVMSLVCTYFDTLSLSERGTLHNSVNFPPHHREDNELVRVNLLKLHSYCASPASLPSLLLKRVNIYFHNYVEILLYFFIFRDLRI